MAVDPDRVLSGRGIHDAMLTACLKGLIAGSVSVACRAVSSANNSTMFTANAAVANTPNSP
jgi:hypothetical protein